MFVTAAYAQSTTTEGAETHDAAAGEVHTETGVAHEGGHGSGVFPPFDSSTFASQLLWLAITFGLFYILMAKVIMPRISGILETRHDKIAQDLDEASRSKAEADAAVAAYEQELAAAKVKGNAIASSAREAAKVKAAAERAAIEASLNDKISAAEVRIADIKTKALADVGSIAEETAGAVVELLIGGKVSKAEIATAVKASAK
ncbi:F0F1 ATP synthase subunit B [Rhizobium sp. 32-5/1]|uniref:F0F1 ATP synthase subunit B n=1 Tax=Rhizobium sp. 32-5/1 TaxID=3019602 RepID=UPI00240DAA94|nr:F0F1 ATP synthase subunit B [Rhizobium sp. 32-5/1]WEZ84224.1 F0F1 ATP synthase subunit B [Rhizobium sp. 32-5/1]